MIASPLSNVEAVFLGGIAGGTAVALQWTAIDLIVALLNGAPAGELALVVFFLLPVAFYAVPGFIVGFTLIGWPVWACLHAVGLRSARAAVLCGALAGLALSLASTPLIGPRTFGDAAATATWLILPGVAASWIVWWRAYGPSSKPPPAPRA